MILVTEVSTLTLDTDMAVSFLLIKKLDMIPRHVTKTWILRIMVL